MSTSNFIGRALALSAVAASILSINSFSAQAETSKKDIQIASKALNFMVPKVKGAAEVAIVFDPNNAASIAEADQIASIIGSGLKVGKVMLSARKISADDLEFSGSKMVLLTSGTTAIQGKVKAAADSAGLLTVSTDENCVAAANCVMGVKSKPKVQITINLNATSAAGIKFSPAFQMMVNKI